MVCSLKGSSSSCPYKLKRITKNRLQRWNYFWADEDWLVWLQSSLLSFFLFRVPQFILSSWTYRRIITWFGTIKQNWQAWKKSYLSVPAYYVYNVCSGNLKKLNKSHITCFMIISIVHVYQFIKKDKLLWDTETLYHVCFMLQTWPKRKIVFLQLHGNCVRTPADLST